MWARLHARFFRPRQELDERLVAESNRIYKTGFWLFVVGYGLYVWHSFMLSQVAFVNDLTPGFETEVSPFLNSWFLLVFAVVGFLLVRKGIFAFDDLDEQGLFPVERCLGASFGSAAVVLVLATLMRALAEFELMGFEGVNWLDDVVIACVFAMEVFVAALVCFAASYAVAKRRRKRLEADLDDE